MCAELRIRITLCSTVSLAHSDPDKQPSIFTPNVMFRLSNTSAVPRL